MQECAQPIVQGDILDRHNEEDYTGTVETLEVDLHDNSADDNYSNTDWYAMYG